MSNMSAQTKPILPADPDAYRNRVISVGGDVKVAYAAVPKAACTTVKHLLLQMDDDLLAEVDHSNPAFNIHHIYQTRRFRPRMWLDYKDYFTLTVLRDPLARLLSVYTNRVVSLKDLESAWKLRRQRPDLPTMPDPDFFFQNLDTYVEVASSIKHHALPCRLFTGPNLSFYSKVYRVEDVNQLTLDLETQTGRRLDREKRNSSQQKLILDDLQPQTVSKIGARLQSQYEDVAGYYENPF